MASPSPTLNLRELRQLQWLLGGLLVLCSLGSVFFLEIEAWGLLLAAGLVTLACLVWPSLPARLPRWAHHAAFPAVLVAFLLDFWLGGQVLPSLIRLALLLLLYRSLCYRGRREDLQLILLGLFLLIVAGVLTVSVAFAVQLLLFTSLALALLLVMTLAEAADPDAGRVKLPLLLPIYTQERPPWLDPLDWRALARTLARSLSWRLLTLGAGLFGLLVLFSTLLFLAIPRYQFENSFFLDRLISGSSRTGFTETVRFGDLGEIVQDTGIALSVDVPSPEDLVRAPYFRMLVLDQYLPEGGFKLSDRARQELANAERSTAVLRGPLFPQEDKPQAWVFYLEAGVSRFLPLPGPFHTLRLRELQNLQYQGRLQIVALRSEPVSMTAYRVEQVQLWESLPDPAFAQRWQAQGNPATPGRSAGPRLWLELPKEGKLKEGLLELGKHFRAEEATSASAFCTAATEWLQAGHKYSLKGERRKGSGDPLLAWLRSEAGGHCELFAGALVALARAHGHPARLVVGFRGGTWNGFSNSLIVRNSNAHAWCEIWDGKGAWLRADPTPGSAGETGETSAEGPRESTLLDRSWEARFNSLRVFWYRRVVSFDQRSQTALVDTLRKGANQARTWALENLEKRLRALKEGLATAWKHTRWELLGTLGLGLALFAFVVARRDRLLACLGQLRLRFQGRDPVRTEARHLLQLVNRDLHWRQSGEVLGWYGELQRLGFGPRETWSPPGDTLRRARKRPGRSGPHGRLPGAT